MLRIRGLGLVFQLAGAEAQQYREEAGALLTVCLRHAARHGCAAFIDTCRRRWPAEGGYSLQRRRMLSLFAMWVALRDLSMQMADVRAVVVVNRMERRIDRSGPIPLRLVQSMERSGAR